MKTTKLVTFSRPGVVSMLVEGTHRVLQVRTAVLDGRFGHQAIQLTA